MTYSHADSNVDYDSTTVEELANELGVSPSIIVNICKQESFNLPFGTDTSLHVTIIDKIKQIQSFSEYETVDNSKTVDVYGDVVQESGIHFQT